MQVFPGELFEEFPGGLLYHLIQFCEHIKARRGDVGPDHAAIVKIAPLADELLSLKASQQTGDVRLRCDHPAADG